MKYWLYTILAVILFFLALPYMLIRMILTGRYREAFWQMLGFWSKEVQEKIGSQGCIWIHAVSVGEGVAASAIVKELRKLHPQAKLLISTVTETGQRMARKIIPEADAFVYFPLDFPWLVRKALKIFQPRVFIMVETELWPNFLRESKKLGISNLVVNGRISDKSLKRYRYLDKFWGGMFQDMLAKVDFFSMQSQVDTEHILALGADPQKVATTGNTKYDQCYGYLAPEEKKVLREDLALPDRAAVFVVGSTHKGEEEYILDCFKEIKKHYPSYVMVLAPRHLDRVGEVENLCKQAGFQVVRRTKGLKNTVQDILILDTIGELGRVYGLAEIVYVGGSLVSTGGHNLLEPAAQGKPVFFGPHMYNFKETTQLVLKHQAGIQVQTPQELKEKVLHFLADKKSLEQIGKKAWDMVEENKGASLKNAQIISDYLLKERLNKKRGLQQVLLPIILGENKGGWQRIFLGGLTLLSSLYRLVLALVIMSYQKGWKKTYCLPGKVISIGNITVGGTGKTPTTKMLAEMLSSLGIKTAILNRGYRGGKKGELALVSDGENVFLSPQEAGDEAYMLAQDLPGVPVIVGKDRVASGQYAMEKLGAQVVLLDDGYQYWRLKKDLNLVLIDASNPFNNGKTLPRGLLREPLTNLNRADIFILTKNNYVLPEEKAKIKEQLNHYNPSAPVFDLIYYPSYLRKFGEKSRIHDFDLLKGKKILAVSGLSNPQFFEQMVLELGAKEVEGLRFADHYNYSLTDMEQIENIYRECSYDLIVTTEKDAVSIPAGWQNQLPLWILGAEVKLPPDQGELLGRMILAKIGLQRGEDNESSRNYSGPLSVNTSAG